MLEQNGLGGVEQHFVDERISYTETGFLWNFKITNFL